MATFASAAALYVSPPSGTVPSGSIIALQMRVNTGTDPVNAVQGNITYNPTQLAYQSIDAAGSAFSLTANVAATSGSLKLARATGGGEPAVKGDVLFATVFFKALTTAGTASVAVASDSHVVRSTDSVDILFGAPAASGAKPTTNSAPKAKAFTSLAQAQAVVAARATPSPKSPAVANHHAPATTMARAESTKVMAWNSPAALGGVALLVALIGAGAYALYRRRHLMSAATAHTVGPSEVPIAPHGSVDPKTGVINSETVFPTEVPKENSDKFEG
ncbi:MAG: hypothetical protein NVSMB39_3910 [Candidatus Saccharimonadales bacterium]